MGSVGSNSHLLLFGEFLGYLRQRGFPIGIDHYLRLHELLNRISGNCTPQDLKTLLSPIFATDKNQQEQFYQAFDSYFNLFRSSQAEAQYAVEKQLRLTIESKEKGTLKIRRWPYVLATILAVLFLFAGLLLSKKARVTKESDLRAQPTSPSSSTSANKENSLAPEQSAKPQENQTRLGSETPVPSPTPQPTAHNLSFYQRYGTTLRGTAIVAPLIIFLFYELYLFKRRKLILQKRRGKKPPLVWPIRVEPALPRLYDSETFHSAARLMRRRQADEFYSLDVEATVAATVESFGYPSFVYKLGSKPPEYLVLIDRSSFRDHQASLFNELTNAFEREGIYVARYFYNGDPRVCCDEAGRHCLNLPELYSRYAAHRLIIIGNGDQMLDPLSGKLSSWTSIFAEWPDRAILTPAPPVQWGLSEISLASQFIVLPATTNGLLTLIDHFSSAGTPDLRSWTNNGSNGLPPQLSQNPNLKKDLRQYLGEEAFQWLCACAVYPELQWDLTLYLGGLPAMGENLVREEHLLRMIRLPWFRGGSMPEDVRWFLVRELDQKKEKAVRSAITQLLEHNPPPEESYAADTYKLNLVIQRWLSGHDRKARRKMLEVLKTSPRNLVNKDYTLLRFLESASGSSFNLVLPGHLRKLFYRHGIPPFGLRRGVRLLITLVTISGIWLATNRLSSIGPSSSPATLPTTNADIVNIDSEIMRIDGGTFRMGLNEVPTKSKYDLSQYPARSVSVRTFWMDKTEVTNAEYADFVNGAKYPAPGYWIDGKPPSGQEQWPVTNVSLADAKAFADWRSKRDSLKYRLPSEAEWEYAARNGPQGTLYPWGNEWLDGRANVDANSLRPVGSYPQGASQLGVLDLIGNAWELTSTKAAPYPGNTLSFIPPGQVIIRGGAFVENSRGPDAITATRRTWVSPSDKEAAIGFRLVSDGPVPIRTSEHERTLSYYFTVQKMRGGTPLGVPFQASGLETYGNGWRFRFNALSSQAGYLYLLNEGPDPTGEVNYNILYPTPSANGGSAQVGANQLLQSGWNVFDQSDGTEKIWIVWSADSVSELEAVKSVINGTIKDKKQADAVLMFLARNSLSKPDVEKDKFKEQTNLKGKGNVLVFLIQLERAAY